MTRKRTSRSAGQTVLRVLNVLLTGLFAVAVAVQYNDPDPARWMLLYGAAAVTSFLGAIGRLRWQLPAAVALVALGWAVTLAPRVLGVVRVADLVSAWEMKDLQIEEGREMYGLLIVFVWMSVLTVVERRR